MDFDTRLGAYAVIVDDQNRVLLALWNEAAEPSWTLPGGGVELVESAPEGAVRELLEETGYEVELIRLLGIDTEVVAVEDRFDPHLLPLKNVRVVYEARVIGGRLAAEIGGTTDEARWIPLTDVAGLRRVSLVDAGIALWTDTRETA